MNRVLWVRWLRWTGWLAAVVCGVLAATDRGMAADIRVLVWDERQPQQKQAYSNWLGNEIASHLRKVPGLQVTSAALDDPGQGLSTLDQTDVLVWWGHVRQMEIEPPTARDIVNGSSERELADILFRFGDEPLAKKIARKITEARAVAPINTTAQLADLVRDAYGSRARTSRMHPATKAFMAIRIAVNDELGALDALLGSIRSAALRVHEGAPSWLSRGARVAVIGFHSLEDRLVKRSFATMQRDGLCTEITNGALVSSESESAVNPRARSAKLRAVTVGRAVEV